MTHSDVWRAIDIVARENKMSCSRLAICCGLDPTTFNKSKRWSVFGKPRWPSMQSISKVLDATDTSEEEFGRILARCKDISKNK